MEVDTLVLKERGYRQLSLPLALLESVEQFLKQHPHLGFTSTPEFVRAAIREKMEKETKKDEQ